MSETTPRAGLVLPGGGSTGMIVPDEVADIDVLNSNFRKIDSLLGARVLPSASSYGGSMDGDLVYAQDTGLLKLYSADEGSLVDPRTAGGNFFKGTKAQRDAFTAAKDGDHWQDIDGDKGEYVRSGGNWLPHFGRELWSGGDYMGDAQRADLSAKISEQPSGIVIAWSRYTTAAPGTAHNDTWHYFFVPKAHVAISPGGGVVMHGWNSQAENTRWRKYVYISDVAITGFNQNNQDPNRQAVMRKVYGV